MCRFKGELMDHLLLHCDVARALWMNMFQIFEVQWVMLSSVVSLPFCWRYQLGKQRSDNWNLVPSCLMWIVWIEQNCHLFEDLKNHWGSIKICFNELCLIDLDVGVPWIVHPAQSFLFLVEQPFDLLIFFFSNNTTLITYIKK